ncbi:MAG: Hpt domain-containing protein, partial [Stellaceae bacterium]
ADTLWQEFAIETDEHLVALEPLLVRLGSADASADDVARLFRAFHSLKSLSRAMALHGMEAVAHRAENLLGLVRDHGVVADKAMVDVLLEAVDSLKELRGAAVGERRDLPAAPEQLNRLDRLFEAGRQRSGAGAPADAPSNPAAAAGADDSSMTQLFAELLQTRLPELAGAAGNDAAARAELSETLEMLAHAAHVMEFEQFGETLNGLRDALTARIGPLDPAAKRNIIDALSTALTQARLLQETLGLDTGANRLAAALAGALKPDLVIALAYLSRAVEHIEEAVLDHELGRAVEHAGEAAAAARQARQLLQCVGADRAAELLLLLEDVTSRAGRGEVPLTAAVTEALAISTHAAAHARDGGDLAAGPTADVEQLVRAALQRGTEEDGGTAISGVRADPATLAALSPDQRRRLGEQLFAGAQAYQLLVHLEDAPSVGEVLIAWLNCETTVIHSQTALTNGQSWFDFLLLSKAGPERVRDALTSRDPERRCVKLLRRLTERAEGAVLLDYRPVASGGTPAPTAQHAGGKGAAVLRVRSEAVDNVVTQIGEIRVAAARAIEALANTRWTETLGPLRRLSDGMNAEARAALRQCIAQLGQQQRSLADVIRNLDSEVGRLQALALELRVVPIDTIL